MPYVYCTDCVCVYLCVPTVGLKQCVFNLMINVNAVPRVFFLLVSPDNISVTLFVHILSTSCERRNVSFHLRTFKQLITISYSKNTGSMNFTCMFIVRHMVEYAKHWYSEVSLLAE